MRHLQKQPAFNQDVADQQAQQQELAAASNHHCKAAWLDLAGWSILTPVRDNDNGVVVAERELVLLKLNCPPGSQRTEVMQLIEIFRARVIDVSDTGMTVCVTGDAGKVLCIFCSHFAIVRHVDLLFAHHDCRGRGERPSLPQQCLELHR